MMEMFQYIPYPLVLLIIALIFMRMFKPQIGGMIVSIRKIGPTGLEAAPPPQQIAVESKTTDDGTEALHPAPPNSFEDFQKAIGQYRFATAASKEEEFKRSADIDSMSIEQLKTIMTQVAGLLMMAFDFENIYNLIFGSQIRLLQDLNSVFAIGRAMPAVRVFYDSAANSVPNGFQNFPFEQWLEFLRESRLIVVEPTGIVKITAEGRDFLRYMAQMGKSPTKLY